MSSETQKHPNTPPCFHAFFSSPLFVFPVPFFPASMHCVYDLMHKQVVQLRATGSHLMHGAARIAFQSRYSHNQTHHFHQQVRVTEQNWQTKIHSMQLDAEGWEASVCVFVCVCVFVFSHWWQVTAIVTQFGTMFLSLSPSFQIQLSVSWTKETGYVTTSQSDAASTYQKQYL